MFKMKSLSMVLSGSLLVSGIAYADFGDALVGGVVGGAVGSVITNEVYRSNEAKRQPQAKQRTYRSAKKRYAPKMTDEKRIQKALSSLGFYRGRIDGEVNSFETRSAIKDMNIAYEIGNSASLKPEAKDSLIFLGTLFDFDRYLIARNSDQRIKSKKIQVALKIHGYYHGKIDGAIGKGTRGSIAQYKGDNGMSYSGSLDFEEEYQLISSAKAKNDKNIEDSIASLKALGAPRSQQQSKVLKLQPVN
jgi:peptidoglycan hydrolase-like protein with peptidoglycan-binding domain